MRIIRRFVVSALSFVSLVVLAASLRADETTTGGLLETIGVPRGICVVVGDESGDLSLDLARQSELILLLQLESKASADQLRRRAAAIGLLGTRLYVEEGQSGRIPLADNLANAVVVAGDQRGIDEVRRAELLRVLQPRGKLIVGKQITIKAVPDGTGEWTHPYHGPDNNPQSRDTLAKAPYLTQFLATPYYGPMPEVTVSAGGRLFKAFGHIAFKEREWPMLGKLIALDGYNGTQLWQRELKPGYMIHRNTIVASPETLFLADDSSCKLIDAATGKIRDEIVVPADLADGPSWKWIALREGVLYALVGEAELIDEVLQGTRKQSGWPWSGMGKAYARKEYPWGFGRILLAIEVATKKILWSRREEEKIDSRAMSLAGGKIFIYSDRKFLAAIDVQSGSEHWRTTSPDLLAAIGPHKKAQNPKEGYSSNVYAKASEEAVYFAGAQRGKLVAVSAKNGKLLWAHPHGNYQLVLRPEGLYAMGRTETSRKLDPLTGEVLAELDCFRGNCTRATGTADSIFTRGYRHTGTMRYDVHDNQARRIPAMRPACQDGVIVANGLLYWGPWMCDCNHSLVGIISLAPAGNFEFEQRAAETDRLQTKGDVVNVAEFSITEADWPTYRGDNRRRAKSPVALPNRMQLSWEFVPPTAIEPTAPVTAGGLALIAGADGVVRAFDVAHGAVRWIAYTGGAIRYPPTISNGRVYVGSGDGRVSAFEAATGRELWRFRAAPTERRIPVYGRLASNWPVAGGVLVENGVAYAAAGIVSHDGTHVYALDAVTGKIKWENNSSGNLLGEGVVAGVSVQGHMLLDGEKLYLAGGNVVSPALYDAATGQCLNTLKNEWQRAPRGSELFLADGEVRVVDKTMYSPREYIPSRYHAKYLLEASVGNTLIQGTESAMMRVELGGGEAGKPQLVWKNSRFVETSAVVFAGNVVLVAGRLKAKTKQAEPQSVLTAIDPENGEPLWTHLLPSQPAAWGLAVDRAGRVIVTLLDGRVLCFGR